MLRAARAGSVAVLAVAVTLSACGEPASNDDPDSSQPAGATVRFRLWDEAAASAYQESFDAFNTIQRDIHVEVEVIPVASYASRAVSDLASGTMADIFWVASDATTEWVELADVVEPAGSEGWEPAVADLFMHDDELWAVPQLWETSTLFVNTGLLEQADVDVTALVWDPAAVVEEPEEPADPDDGAAVEGDDEAGAADAATTSEVATHEDDEPGADESPVPTQPTPSATPTSTPTPDTPADTLREAVRALTRDEAGRAATDPEFDAGAAVDYGFNLDLTAPAVWLTFLAQDARDDESVVHLDVEAAAALDYLRELPAVTAAPHTDRELFVDGHLAMFQSTSAELRHVAEHASMDWAVAPLPAGPDGPVTVVSAIGAAANTHSPHAEATAEVLEWISSTDGQSALASHSVGIPAAIGAQDLFTRAWADRGLETAALLDPSLVVTIPTSARSAEALRAARPVLAQFFAGELTATQALVAAQRAMDEAG